MDKKIEKLFYKLVSIQSDTGTCLEQDVEEYIYNYIKDFDYFQKHESFCGEYTIDEPNKRKIIWGLVQRGLTNKTVILLHHHDVVDALDYGSLTKYAYNPTGLKKALKAYRWPEHICNHLEDDRWIFGRGTADMKAGAAIQIELLRYYSEQSDFNGNLLMLSVPDEETFSLGMRSAIPLLNDLKEKYALSYELLIDSEPHMRDCDNVGKIYDGSVGKIMPVVYVKGVKAHIGSIFSGLNPLLILSKIMNKTETCLDFSDRKGTDASPPPSWSYMKDFKQNYDASIPQAAGGYFSVLTLTQTPKDLLNKLKELSLEAFEEAIEQVNGNYKKFKSVNDTLPWQPRVMYFSELYEIAYDESGETFVNNYKAHIRQLQKKLDRNEITLPETNFELIKKTIEYSKINNPLVIIGISPPFYPHVSIDELGQKGLSMKILESINKEAHKNKESYVIEKYFMGISDMSYTSLCDSDAVVPYIEQNMPLWESVYTIDFQGLKALKIPSINLGPWGNDLHQMTERVFAPDVFHQTPSLIKVVIESIVQGR